MEMKIQLTPQSGNYTQYLKPLNGGSKLTKSLENGTEGQTVKSNFYVGAQKMNIPWNRLTYGLDSAFPSQHSFVDQNTSFAE